MLKKQIKKTIVVLMVIVFAISPIIGHSTVKAGTKSALKKVKKYIEKQEDSTICHDADNSQCSICYDKQSGEFTFLVISHTDTVIDTYDLAADISICFSVSDDLKGKASIIIVTIADGDRLVALSSVNPRKYRYKSNIDFEIFATHDDGRIDSKFSDSKDLQDYNNTLFKACMIVWDWMLYKETGYCLKDIGFKKYKLPSSIYERLSDIGKETYTDMSQNTSTENKYRFYKADTKNFPNGTSFITGVYDDHIAEAEYHSLYIGQLITLFGEADYTTDDNENLISYLIRAEDQDGNIVYLEAYYGPSGPAIGGVSSDKRVKKAADELVRFIRGAEPTDYELTSVYEDFSATVTMGVKDGKPYYKSEISEDSMDF